MAGWIDLSHYGADLQLVRTGLSERLVLSPSTDSEQDREATREIAQKLIGFGFRPLDRDVGSWTRAEEGQLPFIDVLRVLPRAVMQTGPEPALRRAAAKPAAEVAGVRTVPWPDFSAYQMSMKVAESGALLISSRGLPPSKLTEVDGLLGTLGFKQEPDGGWRRDNAEFDVAAFGKRFPLLRMEQRRLADVVVPDPREAEEHRAAPAPR